MTNPDYDYYGLLANTWDVWRDDTANWDDRFFYLDIIRQYGQPVLDIGCGTGRLLLDYLTEGIDIDGLDNSPEMLAICQAKENRCETLKLLWRDTAQRSVPHDQQFSGFVFFLLPGIVHACPPAGNAHRGAASLHT